MTKLKTFSVFTTIGGRKKNLGGAVAMNKKNAYKFAKKVWAGHRYGKNISIGRVVR